MRSNASMKAPGDGSITRPKGMDQRGRMEHSAATHCEASPVAAHGRAKEHDYGPQD